ncbi:GDSL lipase/acylhydrolase [Mucor ambiguus]|uniref:GDSL lipase/acylhydrolase n=1 Tax=Mucor ambiguus TaxID=91626 RepID=A0A0C9N322_9FUNG|nr:GDSL lipase/acylhydrolase [Mucor ambiguus]
MLTKLVLLLTLLSAAASAKEETIKNIVVFGDSYSDVGNHQRLTNGPVWSEHLAAGWNASLYSFAFSGAVCNNDMYPSDDNFIPSITDQVEMFYSQKNLRDLNMEETAIIFWVGVNDVFKMFEKNGNDNMAALEQDYQRVVDCIGINVRNIRRIYASNKFIVFGVPPLERMPFYANTDLASSRETAANQLNEQLTKEVEKMNKHLQSLELDLVDIHKMLDDIVDHPSMFEIINARDPYWDACQGQCTDKVDAYVWWDKTHLTGGVHRLIANSILMAGSLAPETYLSDEVDVNQLLQEPHSPYKSPTYKPKRNTGEIDRVIRKLNEEKEKEQHQHQQEDDLLNGQDGQQSPESSSSAAATTPTHRFVYFGASATIIVSVAFLLFIKTKRRRRNHLAALSGLLKSNTDRGRFMPLRNMDSEQV